MLSFHRRCLELLLPLQRIGDDHGEIVEKGLPTEKSANFFAGRDNLGRITGATLGQGDGEINAGDLLDGFDHLQHRGTVAIGTIEHRAFATITHIFEREAVGAGGVASVTGISPASP